MWRSDGKRHSAPTEPYVQSRPPVLIVRVLARRSYCEVSTVRRCGMNFCVIGPPEGEDVLPCQSGLSDVLEKSIGFSGEREREEPTKRGPDLPRIRDTAGRARLWTD